MIPIPQEKIFRKVNEFRKRQEFDFEFDSEWAEVFVYGNWGELSLYKKRPFFKLEEILKNTSELYLSHNGKIIVDCHLKKLPNFIICL